MGINESENLKLATCRSVTLGGNFILRRKKSPMSLAMPAAAKIPLKTRRFRPVRSTILPAIKTVIKVQAPKIRFRRPKYVPLICSGTTWEIEADQATLVILFASVAVQSKNAKSRSVVGEDKREVNITKNH